MQGLGLQVITRVALAAYGLRCFTVMLLVPLQQDIVGLDVAVRQGRCAPVQGLHALTDLQQHSRWCSLASASQGSASCLLLATWTATCLCLCQ